MPENYFSTQTMGRARGRARGRGQPMPPPPGQGQPIPPPPGRGQPMPHPPGRAQAMPTHPPGRGQPMPHPPGRAQPTPSFDFSFPKPTHQPGRGQPMAMPTPVGRWPEVFKPFSNPTPPPKLDSLPTPSSMKSIHQQLNSSYYGSTFPQQHLLIQNDWEEYVAEKNRKEYMAAATLAAAREEQQKAKLVGKKGELHQISDEKVSRDIYITRPVGGNLSWVGARI